VPKFLLGFFWRFFSPHQAQSRNIITGQIGPSFLNNLMTCFWALNTKNVLNFWIPKFSYSVTHSCRAIHKYISRTNCPKLYREWPWTHFLNNLLFGPVFAWVYNNIIGFPKPSYTTPVMCMALFRISLIYGISDSANGIGVSRTFLALVFRKSSVRFLCFHLCQNTGEGDQVFSLVSHLKSEFPIKPHNSKKLSCL